DPRSRAISPLSLHDALPIWQWYEQQEWVALTAAGGGAFVVLPLMAALATRWLRGAEPLPAAVVDRKLTTPLVTAAIEVTAFAPRSEEHTSELQSRENLVCRL